MSGSFDILSDVFNDFAKNYSFELTCARGESAISCRYVKDSTDVGKYGKQGFVFRFLRDDKSVKEGENADVFPAVVAVKIEVTKFGTRERKAFIRVYDGEFCGSIVRLLRCDECELSLNIVRERVSILVMEYCETNLEEFLKTVSADDYEKTVRRLFMELCNGLKYMKDRGVIHRDIKPGNLLVKTTSGYPHLKIIDFGISKTDNGQRGTTATTTTTQMRTQSHVAPEFGSGEYDYKFDVWSAGVVLYGMMTGTSELRFTPGCALSDATYDPCHMYFRKKFKFDILDFSTTKWAEPELEQAKTVLKSMLVLDPKERSDWIDIQDSDWLTQGSSKCKFSLPNGTPIAYRTLPVLGQGASGVVYRGNLGKELNRNPEEAAQVAVKRWFNKPGLERISKRESDILTALQEQNCKNIIKFYGSAKVPTNDGVKYLKTVFVFDYCPTTLASRIGAGLSEFEAHKFMKDIINAIKVLYEMEYVHRDIKPDNILIKRDGDEEYAVLTDFGTAIKLCEMSETTSAAGTRGYMAPEVEKTDRSSKQMDLYSLGITLMRMFDPNPRKSTELEFDTLPDILRDKVTNSCWNLVQQLTMKDPARRISYEELFANSWVNASSEDLAAAYQNDRIDCIETLMKTCGNPCLAQLREAVKQYCEMKWPIHGEDVKKMKCMLNEFKKRPEGDTTVTEAWEARQKYVEDVIVKSAQLLASGDAEFERLFPLRAISEYKAAIIYLSLAQTCRDDPECSKMIKDLSKRISIDENRLMQSEWTSS